MMGTQTTKACRFPIVLCLMAAAVAIAAPASPKPEASRARAIVCPPGHQQEPLPETGFVPPVGDLSHIRPAPRPHTLAPLPSSFDWREHGKVTNVRNQLACGSCYAFAAVANVESRMLFDGEPAYDFSENNAKECEWYQSSCGGGNYHRMANFFSQKGMVLETCDPYVPANVVCKDTCDYVVTLLGWSLVSAESIPDPDLLKSYLLAYGPLYTSLYAGSGGLWYGELKAYDGSYTLYHETNEEPNHAVLLIGWNDSLYHAGGQGAWIAKNSWGRDWGGPCGFGGQRGFFTMAYGSANMGGWSSSMTEWQDYDPDGRLLYHDEGGYMAEAHAGFEGLTAWGLCKFVPDEDIRIERVEFWATDATTDIDVYVYDSFDGDSLSSLLSSELDQAFPEYGYHSVALSSPVTLRRGDDIYAAVRFTNASFTYPVALDANGTVSAGMCYLSPDGSQWQDVRTVEACENCDACIRLRGTALAANHMWHVPYDVPTIADATGRANAGDTVLVAPGIYAEGSILIDEALVVLSEAGPESTIIDASDTTGVHSYEHIVRFAGVGSGAHLEGFTLTGLENTSAEGVIRITNSTPHIETCVIAGNKLPMGAGISTASSSPHIVGCTIEGNTAVAGVYFGNGCGGELRSTIISNTSGGRAVTCLQGAAPVISCCDFYWNTQGDAVCGTDGGGNFSEDPLFCDSEGDDYRLQDASPCLAGYGCGRVGALGQGCPTETPEALDAFAVTSGDTSNLLEWTLPPPPVQGAYVVYSTSGYPAGPEAGSPVENGNQGYIMGSPWADGSFLHTGLSNDTTYYYAAYAYNGAQLSEAGLTASATPMDRIPPASPLDFSAQPAPGEITLAWTYPPDADAAGVAVRYSTSSYPEDFTAGSPVENGTGGIFLGDPGSEATFTHESLTDDIVYYYAAFAFDEVPNYSAPAEASGAPGDVTPPGSVSGFTAEVGDASLRLRWTNPADADFEGTLVRYSTTAVPLGPTDGSPVENGAFGVFLNVPAAEDSFTHEGLTNGEPYYYAAFAFDERGNYADGVSASAVPADEVAPEGLTEFAAVAGDAEVRLSWTNPGDVDFSHTLIRYSTATYPTAPEEGIGVENGSGGVFANTPASADNFTHSGLTNGVAYFYAAFAADELPNYSSPATVAATPEDINPPAPVVSFTAVPGDGSVRLTWKNPDDNDLAGSLIRYSTATYPAGPGDGKPVENGNSGRFSAAPASVDSFVHMGLVNDTTYYYAIFAFDEIPLHSESATAQVTPYDQTPPQLSVAVFQNPYLTDHLDIYVLANEALAETGLTCSIGDTPVALTVSDPQQHVCRGDYDVRVTGNLAIHVEARDLKDNEASITRSFSSSMILASTGGTALSPDGRCMVTVPPGAIKRDAYVLIIEAGGEADLDQPTYRISPSALEMGDFVEISIAYGPDIPDPEHLCIASIGTGTVTPVGSYLRRDAHAVIAYTPTLGSYALVLRPDELTPEYASGRLTVLQNVPNPFAGSTEIGFVLACRGRIRVEIISVDGRIIRTLLDHGMPPGSHKLEWDGRDSAGNRVASGVYFYRVRAASEVQTRKMVLLQ